MHNSKTRRMAAGITLAVGLLGGLAGCGSDTTSVSYNCCLNNVWYVCTSPAAYGRCLPANQIPDPSGCAAVVGSACPPNSNQ